MHDGGAPGWREIVEASHARLLDELETRIESDMKRAIESAVNLERERSNEELDRDRARAREERERDRERTSALVQAERERAKAELAGAAERAREDARRGVAESLNQALRRLRRAATPDETLERLSDGCATHADHAVVLVFENNQARIAAARGISNDGTAAFALMLEGAPALLSVIENREPVAALARDGEVSAALIRALEAEADERVYLFPVTPHHQVVAVLAVAGRVSAPAAELLAEAASMRLESFPAMVKQTAPLKEAAPGLVRIEIPAEAPRETADRRAWDDLSPEDQMLHLQAQRVARVRVAEMRLNREEAWRRGLAGSNIYGSLRREIESARTEFLQTFLSKSPTMVDYLHLEILRSLAHEDDRVLGPEYPGPMV